MSEEIYDPSDKLFRIWASRGGLHDARDGYRACCDDGTVQEHCPFHFRDVKGFVQKGIGLGLLSHPRCLLDALGRSKLGTSYRDSWDSTCGETASPW